MFSRAEADIKDVQCGFADDEEYGCHAFGLPGELGCEYKHDILTEKEKKVKKDKEKSGSGLDDNGNPEDKEDIDVLPELVEKPAPVKEEKIAGAEVKKEDTGKIKRPWQKNKSKAKKRMIQHMFKAAR